MHADGGTINNNVIVEKKRHWTYVVGRFKTWIEREREIKQLLDYDVTVQRVTFE